MHRKISNPVNLATLAGGQAGRQPMAEVFLLLCKQCTQLFISYIVGQYRNAHITIECGNTHLHNACFTLYVLHLLHITPYMCTLWLL